MNILKAAVLFAALCVSGYAADISFNQALESLYGTHEDIKRADSDLKRVGFERKAAMGLYSPRFYLNAAYMYFGRDLTLDVDLTPMKQGLGSALGGALGAMGLPAESLGGLSGAIPNSMEQVVQNEQFFTLNVSMLWPIFTGGKIYAANQAAKAKYDMAAASKTADRDELGVSLAEKYFSLRLANEVIALKREVRNSMEDHYKRALKLEKAGMLAKVERLHAEMSLSEAEKSLEQSIREARLANTALKSMINVNDDVITPSTPLFIIEENNLDNLAFFQDNAVSANPKLKQLSSAEGLAKAGVTAGRADFIPKINAFGIANLYEYELSPMAPEIMVGVALSMNIFDGLQNYHNYKASQAAAESVRLRSQRASKDIKTLVEQQYIIMENARADYKSSETTMAFAEEYLRARQKAFNQGMATSLDVVDAELALSNAKMSSILAAYKFDMALIKLLETSGMFDSFETFRARASIEPGLK